MKVISTLAGFIPDRVLAGLKAVAVVAVLLGVAWVLVKIEQHGADRIQAKWDKAERIRKDAQDQEIREGRNAGAQAGRNHEADKARLQATLRRTNGALNEALKQASQCGPTADDVVLPGALGMHLNDLRAAGSAASQPAD